MMVCLIFHTVIIINRKNWRITTKLHFENFNIFYEPSLFPTQRTYFLNDPLHSNIIFSLNNIVTFLQMNHYKSQYEMVKLDTELYKVIQNYKKLYKVIVIVIQSNYK